MAKYIICTNHVYPPIPIRQFDWSAWFDDMGEEGPHGEGATEEEAITNLIQHLTDDVEKYSQSPRIWVSVRDSVNEAVKKVITGLSATILKEISDHAVLKLGFNVSLPASAYAQPEQVCPKCGAQVDERFDCCEVHKITEPLSEQVIKEDWKQDQEETSRIKPSGMTHIVKEP